MKLIAFYFLFVFFTIASTSMLTASNHQVLEAETSYQEVLKFTIVEVADLPSPIKGLIEKSFAGYTLHKAEKATDANGDVIYKLTFTVDGSKELVKIVKEDGSKYEVE